MRLALALAALAALAAPGAEGRRQAPLLDEDVAKKLSRAAECTFGGKPHELGTTWFADLGPPFGIMYCVKCECVQMQKKRRMVARVQCRNIKNECPKPSCDEPVLQEGRCCKTCPGDLYRPDTPQDRPQSVTIEEEDRDARHFAAVILGNGHPPAAARFMLHRHSLYFSIEGVVRLNGSEAPHLFQVLDASGNTLQEIPLIGPRLAGRVCGVWKRLPRGYRALLREGKLVAAILRSGEAEPNFTGQIVSNLALGSEMFSALLTSESNNNPMTNNYGATAIITATAGAAPSLHMSIIFGDISTKENQESSVIIKLEMLDKNITILEEVYKNIPRSSKLLNTVEVSSPVTISELRLLARGKLTLTLRSARVGPIDIKPTLRGPVLPRLACEHFYTPLISSSKSNPSLSTGAAWFHFNREGELVYNVEVNDLNTVESPNITLVDDTNKRQLEALTTLRNGISSASLNKMGPRILEPLYSGDMVVNVATRSDGSGIRGRLMSRPVSDISELKGPTLLKRPDASKSADIVGLAWVSVDYECSLQYQVLLSGPATLGLNYSSLDVWLEMRPMIAPGAPIISKKLGDLAAPEGVLLNPKPLYLQRFHSGVCDFVILDTRTNTTLVRAILKKINVPKSCLYADNEIQSSLNRLQQSTGITIGETTSCFHSGRFHDDGTQWMSPDAPCTMCSCHRGQPNCEPVVCPRILCDGDAMIRPGECCPVCSNMIPQNKTSGCTLAGLFHLAGQTWHPYLLPSGYDKCSVCSCDSKLLKVECFKTQCPPLKCSEESAVRPDKKECCKKCPEDENTIKHALEQEILANGGCRSSIGLLENGHEWHPIVLSEIEKCQLCKCKDGVTNCVRKRCPRSLCLNHRLGGRKRGQQKGGAHSKQMIADECCQLHCRRNRRHQRTNRKGS